jgi:hypothetical protein
VPELVTNPTIEVNDTGWQPFFSSCTTARSTTQAHGGTASLSLVAVGANSYIGVQEFTFDLSEGATYTASWWVYLPVSSNYTPIIGDANGDWERAGSLTAITANTWTQLTVASFSAGPWVAGSDEFIFRLNRASDNWSGQTLYWDDFSVDSPAGGAGGATRIPLLGA